MLLSVRVEGHWDNTHYPGLVWATGTDGHTLAHHTQPGFPSSIIVQWGWNPNTILGCFWKMEVVSLSLSTLGSEVGLTLGIEVRIRDNDWRVILIHMGGAGNKATGKDRIWKTGCWLRWLRLKFKDLDKGRTWREERRQSQRSHYIVHICYLISSSPSEALWHRQ